MQRRRRLIHFLFLSAAFARSAPCASASASASASAARQASQQNSRRPSTAKLEIQPTATPGRQAG